MRWPISGVTTRHAMVAPLAWSALFTASLAVASTRPAWLEGGIQAAWRTVELLHDRAMRA